MRLSIITICFNDKAGLQKTAESVCKQTYREFEWIIIDGGSKDGCKEFIENLASNTENNITYWCSEADKGIYNAMNKGIAKAKGEYLLFMNSGDAIYNEDVLYTVVPMLKDKDVYIGNIVKVTNGATKNVIFDSDTPQKLLYRFVFRGIPHQACFISRTLFDKYGGYRENLRIVSDWYHFFEAIALNGATVSCLNTYVAIYDGTGLSSTDNTMMDERITALNHLPLEQELYVFYRDNYHLMTAFKSNSLGHFIMRAYFFIYRKFLS